MTFALKLFSGLIVVAAILFFLFGGTIADRAMNSVDQFGPYAISEQSQTQNQASFVTDLHADPLLWNRDLLAHNSYGQVDLPRLAEGQVAFQVFGIVTKTPTGQNFDSNPSDTDMLPPLTMVSGYPTNAWFGEGAIQNRALHQMQKLHDFSTQSDGALRVIKTKADMQQLIADRAAGQNVIGGLLGLEGMQPIEGELGAVDILFNAGARMGGLAHFFDNEVAGSAHGEEKYGLTDFGRQVISRMEALNMIVDLAHASPKTIDDLLDMATRPVVVSHTGVKGTCGGNRNLSDAHLQRLKANGALIGIGYFDGAVCGKSPEKIADAMIYAINLIGVEHIALGSDFDGAVGTGFDTSGVGMVSDALRARGLPDADIAKVMGLNAQRFFLAALPE